MTGPRMLVLPEILYLLTNIYPFLSFDPWGGVELVPWYHGALKWPWY